MPLDTIDRLKQAYTDQYVIVTGGRPELARFEDAVGQVKTVNMSGRALVEFTGYHNNTAWHDIDTAWLKIVDRPPDPEPPAKKGAAKKAATAASKVPRKVQDKPKSAADILAAARGGKTKPTATAKADAAGRVAKKVSPSASKSTADILAAARGESKKPRPAAPSDAKSSEGDANRGNDVDTPSETPKESAPAGKRESPAVKLSTADVLAAARGKKPADDSSDAKADAGEAPKPAKAHPSGMSTADILAAARGQKPAESSDKPADTEAPASDAPEVGSPAATEPRKQLSAADILAIASGKLSYRREQPIATAPRASAARPVAAEPTEPDALPKPIDRRRLTAADIRDLGKRK